MKHTIILIQLSLLIFFTVKAQQVTFVEPRTTQEVERPTFEPYAAGGRYYILQKQFNMSSPVLYDMQLDAYGSAYKPMGSNVLDKTLAMGDANLQNGFFVVNNQLVQFKSEFKSTGSKKKMLLYYYIFDKEGNRQKGQLLAEFPSLKALNAGNFHVNVSEDGSKVAVFCEMPFVKNTKEEAILMVFDADWNQLWKETITFPYDSRRGPQNDLFVSNQGEVAIVKQVKVKKEADKFQVFTFSRDGKMTGEAAINPSENFTISTYEGHFNQDGKLILSGNYYKDQKVGINVETPDGPFFALIDPLTGTIPLMQASTYTRAHQNLVVLDAFVYPDNSVLLVSEQVYEKSTARPGGGFEYDYEYNHKNIVVARLNSDGGFEWEYVIERDLKSMNDGGRFFSVVTGPAGEETRLLYRDDISKYGTGKQAGTEGYVVMTLGSDGNLKQATAITDQRIAGMGGQYSFIPSSGIAVSANEWFLLAARGKELVGVKLAF